MHVPCQRRTEQSGERHTLYRNLHIDNIVRFQLSIVKIVYGNLSDNPVFIATDKLVSKKILIHATYTIVSIYYEYKNAKSCKLFHNNNAKYLLTAHPYEKKKTLRMLHNVACFQVEVHAVDQSLYL